MKEKNRLRAQRAAETAEKKSVRQRKEMKKIGLKNTDEQVCNNLKHQLLVLYGVMLFAAHFADSNGNHFLVYQVKLSPHYFPALVIHPKPEMLWSGSRGSSNLLSQMLS